MRLSGGSIAVRAGTVTAPQGTGIVDANGGAGGRPGGGGGGGGRVWLGPAAEGGWTTIPTRAVEKIFYVPRGGGGDPGGQVSSQH